MIKKDIYESPEMEIVLFDVEDILTSSGDPDAGDNIDEDVDFGEDDF